MECHIARDGWSGTLGRPGENTYTVPYWVIADNNAQEPKEIIEACQLSGSPDVLPTIYQNYSYNGSIDYGAFALSIGFKRDAMKASKWHLTVNYGPLPPGTQPGDNTANPLDRSTKYWLEFETLTEQITKAYNVADLPNRPANTLGPVTNAAGIEFDETLFEDVNRAILVAEKPFATLSEIYGIDATFGKTLNNDTFFGRPKGHAQFHSIDCNRVQTENNIEYYTGTIRVILSRTPLYREVVNQGWAYRDGFGELHEFLDADGNRVSEPQLLTPTGQALASGLVGNTISYRTREFVNYSGLGI